MEFGSAAGLSCCEAKLEMQPEAEREVKIPKLFLFFLLSNLPPVAFPWLKPEPAESSGNAACRGQHLLVTEHP